MIYTIGFKRNYEEYLLEMGIVKKLGRGVDHDGKPYSGGSVWKTFEEAKRECPEGYKVYGVLANWETDTVPSDVYPGSHDLLVTSLIVRIRG